jgi:hypothetical protein
MTSIRQELYTGVTAWSDAPPLVPALVQALDDVEQAITPRQEPSRRPILVSERTPRPFAYD